MAKVDIVYKVTERPIESVTLELTEIEARVIYSLVGSVHGTGQCRVATNAVFEELKAKLGFGAFSFLDTSVRFKDDKL